VEQNANRAKDPVSAALAGPYGHPFHPMLVTLPIGAWICSVIFDVASHLAHSAPTFATGAEWLIGIGVLGALAAASVGFLDFLTIPTGTAARRTAVMHMVLNLGVTVAFAASFAWRLGSDRSATGGGPLVLSVVGLAALSVSGALGGKLAYHYGIRVADEQTQVAGFAPTSARDPDGSTGLRPRTAKGR
jgi:uncharacterized membrane protein